MTGLFRFLDNLFAAKPSAPSVVLVQQRASNSPAVRSAGPRILVHRNPRPYWEERGWRRQGRRYEGTYQTAFGRWSGYATESPSGRVEVFIRSPPSALERHPHWQCFNKRTDGWYFVHPVTPIADVSAGIISVEKTINEAYAI
jgi:hypothetical protein